MQSAPSSTDFSLLPPSVSIDIGRASLRDYWLARAAQHTHDSYAGVPMSKFPEDLRAYEHLLWLDRPDTIIELGVHYGGASLWFRDRLRALVGYGHIKRASVIGVEIDAGEARRRLARADPEWERDITLIEGDVTDPELPERVAAVIEPGARCLVIEDTAHTYETTSASLRGFSRFVPNGGFFVVEDGTVDREHLRLDPSWPRGVLRAVEDWLATEAGSQFTVRRELELYGISNHPSGFLQRRSLSEHPHDDGDPPVKVRVQDFQSIIARLEDSDRQKREWIERAMASERMQADWQARATEAEHQHAAWGERAHEAERRLEEAERTLATISQSVSWRVTRPLRDLAALWRRRQLKRPR